MTTALIVLGVIAGAWLVVSAAFVAAFALASHWLNPHQPAPTTGGPMPDRWVVDKSDWPANRREDDLTEDQVMEVLDEFGRYYGVAVDSLADSSGTGGRNPMTAPTTQETDR